MKIVNDSITVVLVGDWNKTYIQPEWVAANIFESPEIEIGVEGNGANFRISYRDGEVIIQPTQSRISFSSTTTACGSLELLSKCIRNFVEKATTPLFAAYGLNVKYSDDEDTRLANVFDSISDTSLIIDLGYQIEATKIERSLSKDGRTINMTCKMEGKQTVISFNEHHNSPTATSIDIEAGTLMRFIAETRNIVNSFGYEMEDDET